MSLYAHMGYALDMCGLGSLVQIISFYSLFSFWAIKFVEQFFLNNMSIHQCTYS